MITDPRLAQDCTRVHSVHSHNNEFSNPCRISIDHLPHNPTERAVLAFIYSNGHKSSVFDN